LQDLRDLARGHLNELRRTRIRHRLRQIKQSLFLVIERRRGDHARRFAAVEPQPSTDEIKAPVAGEGRRSKNARFDLVEQLFFEEARNVYRRRLDEHPLAPFLEPVNEIRVVLRGHEFQILPGLSDAASQAFGLGDLVGEKLDRRFERRKRILQRAVRFAEKRRPDLAVAISDREQLLIKLEPAIEAGR
jgi:hypothetical protein